MSNTKPPLDRQLTLNRTFDAPRALVWKAWTDPAHLVHFWGPHGMTTPVCEIDLRPGGTFHTVMRDPDGNEHPSTGVYLDVTAPERLVFTDAYVSAWEPSEKPFMTMVLTLTEDGDKTNFTAEAKHWSVDDRQSHQDMGFESGWGAMTERLADHLKSL